MISISERRCSSSAQTDNIAGYSVIDSIDVDALVGVAGKDVSRAGCSADCVITRTNNDTIAVLLAGNRIATTVHTTYETIADRIAHRSRLDLDARQPEIANDQATDHATGRSNTQGQAIGVEIVTIQNDRNKATCDVACLCRTIDGDLIGDGWQDRCNVADLCAAAGDVERDDVRTRVGIGIEDRLAERAGTRVVGVGDGVGGKQATVGGLEGNAKGIA